MEKQLITVKQITPGSVDISVNSWCIGIINKIVRIEIVYHSTTHSFIRLYGRDGYVGVILGVFDYGQPGLRR